MNKYLKTESAKILKFFGFFVAKPTFYRAANLKFCSERSELLVKRTLSCKKISLQWFNDNGPEKTFIHLYKQNNYCQLFSKHLCISVFVAENLGTVYVYLIYNIFLLFRRKRTICRLDLWIYLQCQTRTCLLQRRQWAVWMR